VLTKEAKPVYIDVELKIVVTSEYESNPNIIIQNVKDAVTSSLNISKFGQIVDASDVILTAQTVKGVDRVRIIQFNKANESGSVLSISAKDNEYLQSNNIVVNPETR
jgi:HD superfamily phosphohydrolase YqeK